MPKPWGQWQMAFPHAGSTGHCSGEKHTLEGRINEFNHAYRADGGAPASGKTDRLDQNKRPRRKQIF